MTDPAPSTLPPPAGDAGPYVHRPVRHESAALHVSGEARYTDDLPLPAGTLHAALGLSERAHARIVRIDLDAVRAAPGVVDAIVAADLPGANDFGPILHDDPLLAAAAVVFHGQALFAVLADTVGHARAAARLAVVEYEDRPAIPDIDAALAAGSELLPAATLGRGDATAALAAAPLRLSGRLRIGGQEHFALEGQVAVALPLEDGQMRVYSSTQHPSEVQALVAHALGLPAHAVMVECRRIGGGFGGKETQPAQFACLAAVLARRSGRPVKLRMDRIAELRTTGKRHDFRIDWVAGFDADGRVLGLKLQLAARCGHSADLSGPVNDRALFHADNAYWLPACELRSLRLRTHTLSNTAFRGFGGPQGMMAIEHVLDTIARRLGRDPLDVRLANLYAPGRDTTPFGMRVEDADLPARLIARLVETSDYRARRTAIAAFNAASPVLKKGLALTPVKFGIAFTATHYNQAGALLHIYQDGSVLLNHGGIEMGQGLHTKLMQIVADTLGVSLARVRTSATDTGKVPNTSATAASSGTDLNGRAAQLAAETLRERLRAVAAERYGAAPAGIAFADDRVRLGDGRELAFAELVQHAYLARVSLSATGYYRTPKIRYERATLSGRPFFYWAWGAAVSEVAIDTLSGENRLLRVDILHDAGRSLNPALDRGQIEGGFLQGYGWLSSEELVWNADGSLASCAPSTYKIPTAADWPADARIAFWDEPNREDAVYRAKAVGEPPLMLAISAFHAVRDAIAACGPPGAPVALDAPATPEAILRAVHAQQAIAAAAAG